MPRRGKYLQIRTTPAERALLAERAAARGQTVSGMVREAVGLDSPLAPEARPPRGEAAPAVAELVERDWVSTSESGNPSSNYHFAVTPPAQFDRVGVAPESPAIERAGFSCPVEGCNWSTIVPGLSCPTHG